MAFPFNKAQLDWLGGADPEDPYIIDRMPASLGPKPNYLAPPVSPTDAVSGAKQQTVPPTGYTPGFGGYNAGVTQMYPGSNGGIPGMGGGFGAFGGQGGGFHDYQHAQRLFITNGFALAPKHTFLFHVFFDNTQNIDASVGMMVKQVTLPRLNIDTKTVNAYNRPYIVQTKIRYDPVSITFHDDASDMVRQMLFAYYRFYYADSNGTDYGYRGDTKTQFFRSIRIYSLFNKMFSEYILVNPIIKSIQHPEHHVGQGGDVMQHQITVEYETLLLTGGAIGSIDGATGFATLNYDNTPSPIPHTAGNCPIPMSQGYPSSMPGAPFDPYAGTFNGNAPTSGILGTVNSAIGAATTAMGLAASVIGTASAFKSGNLVGAVLGAATGITQVERLMGVGPQPMPLATANSMQQGLQQCTNPNAPVTIPSVGGTMTGIGGIANTAATLMSGIAGAFNVGTSIISGRGIPSRQSVDAMTAGFRQVESFAGVRPQQSTANPYYGASTMGPPLPQDLLLARAMAPPNPDVRPVTGLPTYNQTTGNSDPGSTLTYT